MFTLSVMKPAKLVLLVPLMMTVARFPAVGELLVRMGLMVGSLLTSPEPPPLSSEPTTCVTLPLRSRVALEVRWTSVVEGKSPFVPVELNFAGRTVVDGGGSCIRALAGEAR